MAVFDLGYAYIGADESSSWNVYGFNEDEWVGFSIAVYPLGCQGIPDARASLTQGESSQYTDGSKAHKIVMRNTGIDCIGVHVLALVESV